jgi:hypothetical protein
VSRVEHATDSSAVNLESLDVAKTRHHSLRVAHTIRDHFDRSQPHDWVTKANIDQVCAVKLSSPSFRTVRVRGHLIIW